MQKRYIGGIVFLVVIIAIVATVGLTIHSLTNATTNGNTTTGQQISAHTYSVTESVFPSDPCNDATFIKAHPDIANTDAACKNSSNQDWVNYSTPDIVVGANSLITVTIVNYTRPNSLTDPFLERVQGTIGGTISVNGKRVSTVSPTVTSHTFIIHGIADPSQPWLYVSVPVTEANLNAGFDADGFALQPTTTVFQFHTQGPGKYIWNCEAPCGTGYAGKGGPMSSKGYMSGTFTVQ